MPSDPQTARNEICSLLKAKLVAAGEDILVVWDGTDQKEPEPPSSFIRFRVQHLSGGQTAVGRISGRQRYSRRGMIIASVHTPPNDGMRGSDKYAPIILQAFEGKDTPSGVWFLNGRFQEIGTVGSWHQTNVYVDFEYDEIK